MTTVLPEEGTDPRTSPSGGTRVGNRRSGRRLNFLPYWLLIPTLVGLGLGLGYPLVRLLVLSTQDYGLKQQFGQPAEFIGLDNFSEILGDSYFWEVLRRSLVFCIVNVVLTMVLGTLVALLMGKLGRVMRTTLSVGLLMAWATPALTATVLWQWLFDSRSGLVNYTLDKLGFDYKGHSWLTQPFSFYVVATLIVVWMGIPFIAFTLHAAMTQIPGEVMEAASIDGANRRQRFRDVVWPGIKPIFVVLAALSTVWDLRVFTQIYVLQQAGSTTRETNLLGTWAYREAYAGNSFGKAAAIALVMLAITLLLTLFHIRQMFRQDEI
jgi:N,N'-diacetylchitobiose transport system permease protein